MTTKAKCSKCNERDVFSKGLCTRCYGHQWREDQKAKREGVTVTAIEGEVVESTAIDVLPPTHLVATNPVEMKAAQGDLKQWLETKLDILERDIREANAALEEARRNGWVTTALTHARNRAVDDETFYNKILIAVEAGHTMIPDFPIDIFAVRLSESETREERVWAGYNYPRDTHLGQRPATTDCAPAGAGEFRNPVPEVFGYYLRSRTDDKGKEYTPYQVTRTGEPAGGIAFPKVAARAPIMKATSDAMAEKAFDQIGICFPIEFNAGARRIQPNAARAGDPLIIGQVVHKRVGGRQKVASFLIAWHLNLNDL